MDLPPPTRPASPSVPNKMLALLFSLGEPPHQLRLPLLLKCLAPQSFLRQSLISRLLKMLEFGYHFKKQSLQLQLHNKCAYLEGRIDSKPLWFLFWFFCLFFPISAYWCSSYLKTKFKGFINVFSPLSSLSHLPSV